MEHSQPTHSSRSVNPQYTVSQHTKQSVNPQYTVSQHTVHGHSAHGTRLVSTRNKISQHTKQSVNTQNTASQHYPPRDPRSVTHPPGISSFLRRQYVALSTVVGFVEAEHVAGGVVAEPHGIVHPVSPPHTMGTRLRSFSMLVQLLLWW